MNHFFIFCGWFTSKDVYFRHSRFESMHISQAAVNGSLTRGHPLLPSEQPPPPTTYLHMGSLGDLWENIFLWAQTG